MKTFPLLCDGGHEFELMVKSAEALADQQARGLVTCPYCNSASVERTLARPAVQGGKGRGKAQSPTTLANNPPSKADLEKAYRFFSEMRSKVEKTHEDVGDKFADQALAMHNGEIAEKGIYGSASATEVKELLEEGVEIAPLPDLPKHNA